MSLKGSQTEKNLLKAFAGESQARNRYTYFASVAKREGFEQISAIFQETADNEKEHAQIFFKHLQGGEVEITASYPAGKISKKDTPVKWKCRNCGYVHVGKDAPDQCPACQHARSYYEVMQENY